LKTGIGGVIRIDTSRAWRNKKVFFALCAALLCAALLAALAAPGCGRGGRSTGRQTPSEDSQKSSVFPSSLEYGGRQRTYIVHLPPSYSEDSARRFPLVLVLHGGTIDAVKMERLTGMDATADREGFIAVYPNGTGRFEGVFTWNVGFGYGYALENNVDDVGFLRKLIKVLENDYSIDPGRVYVTGISNGGILAYRLASEAPDLIAAAAPVAAVTGGRENPDAPLIVFGAAAQPVPVIAFHGKADAMIPYFGGQGTKSLTETVYISVLETISLWAQYDGCSAHAQTETSTSGDIMKDTYSGGRGGAEVVLYTIAGGTHSWPGGNRLSQTGPEPTKEISANDLMWEFFKAHPRI
jgi:polyhydroxybutyrate depolymerase